MLWLGFKFETDYSKRSRDDFSFYWSTNLQFLMRHSIFVRSIASSSIFICIPANSIISPLMTTMTMFKALVFPHEAPQFFNTTHSHNWMCSRPSVKHSSSCSAVSPCGDLTPSTDLLNSYRFSLTLFTLQHSSPQLSCWKSLIGLKFALIPIVVSMKKVFHSYLTRVALEWIPKQYFSQSHEEHLNMRWIVLLVLLSCFLMWLQMKGRLLIYKLGVLKGN